MPYVFAISFAVASPTNGIPNAYINFANVTPFSLTSLIAANMFSEFFVNSFFFFAVAFSYLAQIGGSSSPLFLAVL